MSKETNQALMQNAVNNFTKVTRALHGDYAYSSGYYESSLLMLFAELPAQKQEMYLSMMQNSLKRKTLELADENVKKQVSLAVA
jgi:hypothetical protein